ncbi:MAG: methyltransferase domain-containing protein [Parcubacteria group bacterium]|nr:methyltransferase domain-containing protein [Parcubacteria group bacterium]
MKTEQQKIVDYYQHPETRLGFNFILCGSKHFGYYPNRRNDISEKRAQVLLQDLVAKNLNLQQNQRVLDAGCGQGVVSTYLAKKYGAEIFGITLVPFEVKKAKKLARKFRIENKTDYQIMDYSIMTFHNNYFDAIYTTETLSHSPNILKTLKEFYRVLKPNGKIALFEYTVAPDEKFSEWEKKMLNLVIDGSAMMGLKDFRHDQFTEIVQNAGFENVKEQNITENIRPSFYRLYKLSVLPYKFIKFFGLQRFFINTTAGYEYYKMNEKGLFRYCIFTANKPK